MEASVTVGLVLSGIIFIVGMIGGYIPLYREWSLDKLSLMVAFGGGTLLAAALFLMMPEGLHHLEEMMPHEEADLLAAVSVVVGFLLMAVFVRVSGLLRDRTIRADLPIAGIPYGHDGHAKTALCTCSKTSSCRVSPCRISATRTRW